MQLHEHRPTLAWFGDAALAVAPASPEATPAALPGLARYTVLRLVGAGGMGQVYQALDTVLEHQPATLVVAVGTLVLTVVLYVAIPKGFFPVQDTGLINGV